MHAVPTHLSRDMGCISARNCVGSFVTKKCLLIFEMISDTCRNHIEVIVDWKDIEGLERVINN